MSDEKRILLIRLVSGPMMIAAVETAEDDVLHLDHPRYISFADVDDATVMYIQTLFPPSITKCEKFNVPVDRIEFVTTEIETQFRDLYLHNAFGAPKPAEFVEYDRDGAVLVNDPKKKAVIN